jgi:hypothetical protein
MQSSSTAASDNLVRPVGRPRAGTILLALSTIGLAIAGGFYADRLGTSQPVTIASQWSGDLPKTLEPMAPVSALVAPLSQPEPRKRFDTANYELLFGPSMQATAFVRPQRQAEAPLLREIPPAVVASVAPPPLAEREAVEPVARPGAVPLPLPNPFRPRATARNDQQGPQKRVVASAAPSKPEEGGFFQKLFGGFGQAASPGMAYARTEEPTLTGLTPGIPRLPQTDSNRTAVYDIDAKTVYMPNGERLEAHSGLGEHFDNPRSATLKDRGVTPPNVYELTMREELFHGVRALRMTPQDNSKMFGRDGILAHSFMLGPRGDSNGCVSFRNYDQFLQAYLRGEVKRIVVVASSGQTVAQRIAQSRT